MIYLDRLENVKCLYSVCTQCMKQWSVVWPGMHRYRSQGILVSQNGGPMEKKRGCLVNFFFTQFGCGWAVDEYFQPSWLFVLKQVWVLLPDSHWGEWPLWDAATPWHITPDLLLCLVGKHPLLCFAIILLDTGVSNNSRNHRVSLCRKN